MSKYMSTESNWGYRMRLSSFWASHKSMLDSLSISKSTKAPAKSSKWITWIMWLQRSIWAGWNIRQHLRIICLRMLMLYYCKCLLINANANTVQVPVQVLSKFLAICKWYWSMQINLGNLWLYYTPSLQLNSETLFWPMDCYRRNRLT